MEKEKNDSKLDDYNSFLEASNNINDRINDLSYKINTCIEDIKLAKKIDITSLIISLASISTCIISLISKFPVFWSVSSAIVSAISINCALYAASYSNEKTRELNLLTKERDNSKVELENIKSLIKDIEKELETTYNNESLLNDKSLDKSPDKVSNKVFIKKRTIEDDKKQSIFIDNIINILFILIFYFLFYINFF